MSTPVRSELSDVTTDAYTALEAAGDGALVIDFGEGTASVRYATTTFAINFAQRSLLGGRPMCIELPSGEGNLATLLESKELTLPWRGHVLVNGVDLVARRATLAIRPMPASEPSRRVCCVLVLTPASTIQTDAVVPAEVRHDRAAMSQLSAVIAVVDTDGRIIYQSTSISELTRYDPKQRLGRPIYEVIHPEDHACVRDWLRNVSASGFGAARDNEYRIIRHDGEVRWLHVRAVNFLADPVVNAIVLQVADCTERRVEQLLLSRAQESLRLAVDAARIGFWEYSLSEGAFFASSEYLRLRGDHEGDGPLSSEEFWKGIHPDDVERARTELGKVSAGSPELWDSEYRLRTADDGWIWVQQRGRVVARNDDGVPTRLAGVVFDIDRRKRAELELRAQDQRFRLAALASRGHIYEYDPQTGGVTRWVGGGALIGVLPIELKPTADAWLELVHPDDVDLVRDIGRWPSAGDGIVEANYRVRHTKGHFVDVWDRAVRIAPNDPQDQRMLGIVVDVSAQRRVERLLANAESVARVASWVYDVATQDIVWSREAYVLHGVTPETYQPTADSYPRFLTPQSKELLWAHNAACIREAGSYEIDLQVVPADGKKRWMRFVAVAEVVDGRVRRLLGAIQDIDAHKRRGIRLQRQSHWLTLALTTNDLTTWRWYPDTDQFVLDHRSHGYLADLPVRQPLDEWLAMLAADERDTLRRALVDAAGNGSPVDLECRMECGLGSDRYVAFRAERVVSPDGVALIGTLRDVTASRAIERHLRTQAEVLASMSEGVCVVGADGAVRLTNPAFDRMFSAPQQSIVGKRIDELIALPASGRAFSDIKVVRSDGTHFFAAITHSALEIDGEPQKVLIVRDITYRKELQSALLETVSREQRRIGSDLHDGLGQELTGIALMLRGLEERVARGGNLAPKDIGEIVGLVNQAIQSTRALARGLSPVAIERGGLAIALRALVARARELYGLDIRFHARSAAEITLEPSAKTHLYRIVQEALTNVARHAKASQVVVRMRVLGNRVSLSIEDDGIGIGANADGGMGLQIMRYRAELIGAALKVTSVQPHGTRIYCTVVQPANSPAPNVVAVRTVSRDDAEDKGR